jgi:enoyl-CoA hydratase/carnithine racemase
MTELLREDRGPIVVLTLHRPARRNALSRSLVAALSDTLDGLAASPTVRAVLLAGSGPVFCAGMDLKEAAALGEGVEAEAQAVGDAKAFAQLLSRLHGFPRPTVASVHGDALAGAPGWPWRATSS